MRLRISATLLYVVVLGAASLDVGFLRDLPDEFGYGLLVLGVAVGFVAGRWWVLASALTPVAALAYLAAVGHQPRSFEGSALAVLLYLGPFAVAVATVPLLVGLALRKVWDARRRQRPLEPGSSPAAVSR